LTALICLALGVIYWQKFAGGEASAAGVPAAVYAPIPAEARAG
jgi:hypothetical protein